MEERLINVRAPFISVTGGGGKTTFLREFGRYLKKRGMSVLLTTTTKLAPPEREDYGEDFFFTSLSSLLSSRPLKGTVTLFASQDEKGSKLYYPGKDAIVSASALFDVVLCEADGSRQRPVKIHTKRDPVVLSLTTGVVSLLGIWGVGGMTADVAFGEERNVVIDGRYLTQFLSSPEGLLKGMREDTENIILFNGGDGMTEKQRNTVLSLSFPSSVSAYIVSERKGVIYDNVRASC